MDQLHLDVLLIIFSKLQVKTILGLRCVCKLWSQIIDGSSYGPYLAETHINRAMEEPRILVLNEDYKKNGPYIGWIYEKKEKFLEISAKLIPGQSTNAKEVFFLEGSCHGILCFKRLTKENRFKTYLLNPFRQQVLELPDPKFLDRPKVQYWNYGLGFDKLTRRYKVICVYQEEQEDYNKNKGLSSNLKVRGEIYTLGTRSQWRELTKSQPQHTSSRESIFVDGVIYWERLNALSKSIECNPYYEIMAFHMEEEDFRLVSVPTKNKHNYVLYKLVDFNGVLGFVDFSCTSHIEIWTLKDYKKENWVKMYKLEMRAPERWRFDFHPTRIVGPWENGELLLNCFESFISYNPNTNTLKDVPHLMNGRYIYSYTASLVSLSWFNDG